VTHILWAATNHQWGIKKTPTDGSFTLSCPHQFFKNGSQVCHSHLLSPIGPSVKIP
jgi:hypothetical protein